MKKPKLDSPPSAASVNKRRSFQILLAIAFLYLLFTLSQFPSLSISPTAGSSAAGDHLRSRQDSDFRSASKRPYHLVHTSRSLSSSPASPRRSLYVSGLKFADYEDYVIKRNFSELHRSAKEAWDLGLKVLKEINNSSLSAAAANEVGYNEKEEEACPPHVMLTGGEFTAKGKVMMIPCGLTLGSHITLVATPFPAHPEYNPKIAILEGEGSVMVSQFMMELQGLKAVEGEEAPKILHFNPRLKGDWSGRPVIEQNTCYRMQWHTALRCEGWRSRADEETGTNARSFG